jgi:glycosyltransferase involved in cell wall biosynthesis
MFFGIPCVLTNVGGIPSIFKNQISCVTLFEPYDFRGMSKEISKLINDKDYYLKLSSLNKKIAKNFSIRKSLGLVEANYKMLLNAK